MDEMTPPRSGDPGVGSALLPRRLGRSGIEAAPLGVGCWAIGGAGTNLGLAMGWATADDAQALTGLRRAYELGARLFDTADVYGHGHSERLLGRLVRDVPRSSLVIASKVGYFGGTAANAYQPLHMRHQLEQTLENLGTDYVDAYFVHNNNFGAADAYLEGAIEQMHSFKQQGMVRAIGMRGPHRFVLDRVTKSKAERENKRVRFQEVAELLRPDLVAVRYNLLTPDDPDGIFEWAARRDIGVLINKPLAQGLLSGKHRAEEPPVYGAGDHRQRKRWFTAPAQRIIQEGLQPLRERFGTESSDLVRVALRACLQRAENAAVLVGFTTAEQIEMNFSCLGAPLEQQELRFARACTDRLRERLDAAGETFLDELPT